MAIVGTLFAIAVGCVGVWLAVRKRRDKKRKQERKEDIELSGKFARLETQVGSIERQYTEFRDTALREQEELVKRIDEISTRSDQYQKTADVAALRQDVQQIDTQLKRLDDEFRRHRDMVLEKYLTLTSYQNDLIMWTKTFDNLQQSLRDVHVTLSKRSR